MRECFDNNEISSLRGSLPRRRSVRGSSRVPAPRGAPRGAGTRDEPQRTSAWEATCVAVVSVSFKPSGASARGHWAKRSKKVEAPPPRSYFFAPFCQMPSRACPAWLEGNGNDCYAGYEISLNLVRYIASIFWPLTCSVVIYRYGFGRYPPI